MGQVCLSFTGGWLVLSITGIVMDDWLRYVLFKEEMPKYKWWFGRNKDKKIKE